MTYAYEPLLQHIAVQSTPRLSMSYSEIERILGRALPPSARNDKVRRQWWANTETHTQAKAWLMNGRKAKLDTTSDTVTFYKQDNSLDGTPMIMAPGSDDIHLSRARLQPAAIRLIEDYAEERSVDIGEAVTALLNQAALRRRRETLDWFAHNTVMSEETSAELIRADRDGR